MSARIKTIQAQQAELGRLRTGTSVPTGKGDKRRAERSSTWILTSDSETYIRAAAAKWGGTPEPWQPQRSKITQWRVVTDAASLDALLPSGDPLSAYNELWDRGGIQRRCDGETELTRRQPCLCLRQFGPEWHKAPSGQVCKPTSRLRLYLPDMPDFGIWRAESHSFYAAAELAGQVDAVREGTGGQGTVPVRLIIQERQVVREGLTKRFPVVRVIPSLPRLRHALNGPLTAQAALDPASLDRTAIEAARERPDYEADAAAALAIDDVHNVWYEALEAGDLTEELKAVLINRAAEINAEAKKADQDDDEPIDAELVDDEQPPHPAPTWPQVAHIPGAPERREAP
ncbi:hypothetical protein [Embleya sp. NPDC059237]|uniref:recombination directionality factor n=1 Tax=Embleya sp. NPDC059237 TaxID=3346784 RepID=UPI0036863C25